MKKFSLAKAVRGKSLYIAIAACAVVVGGAGIFAYNKAVKNISSEITFTPPASTTQQGQSAVTTAPGLNANSPLLPSMTTTVTQGASFGIDESLQTILDTQPNFMPVAGERVINPFSGGELVKSETLGVWKTHDGVDIAAAQGAEVKAMTKGVITEIKTDPMWGNCIVIDHGNGITGYYYNLAQAMAVKEGDKVDAGDVIGAVGSSAEEEIAMESHLHFALKQNGEWIDPIEYINPSNK